MKYNKSGGAVIRVKKPRSKIWKNITKAKLENIIKNVEPLSPVHVSDARDQDSKKELKRLRKASAGFIESLTFEERHYLVAYTQNVCSPKLTITCAKKRLARRI